MSRSTRSFSCHPNALAQITIPTAHRLAHGETSPWPVSRIVARASNILVVGKFAGTIDFGCGNLPNPGPLSFNVFLAKIDPSGQCLWSRSYGDAGDQGSQSVTIDASNDVTIEGHYDGTIDFSGCSSLTNADSVTHGFRAQLDPDGACLSAQDTGAWSYPTANSVILAIDTTLAGYVLAGSFTGQINFGGAPFVSAGGSDVYVARFGP